MEAPPTSKLRDRKIALRLDASEVAVIAAQGAADETTLSEAVRRQFRPTKTNAPSAPTDDALLTPKAIAGAFRSCLPE